MLRWFFSVCLLVLAGVVSADDDAHIVLPPPGSSTSLPTKMLVFIPGGDVPNTHYVATSAAIQQSLSASANLWVVIPAVAKRLCIFSCVSSGLCGKLHGDIEAALKLAQNQGWAREDDKKDVFLGGHSLGGTCANYYMQAYKSPFAALILMGSYVDKKGTHDVENFDAPVMTLNTELDGGMARPGKTSIWWRQFLSLRQKDKFTSVRDKPVIVLPSLNHSIFCPGFDVPGDLPSEIGQAQGTAIVGKHVAAFLANQINRDNPSSADLSVVTSALQWTESLLTPYITAEDITVDELTGTSPFCAEAQSAIVGLKDQSTTLTVQDSLVALARLEFCEPEYSSDGRVVVNTCSHVDRYADVMNTGSIEATKQLACKMLSYDRMSQLLNVATVQLSCSDINQLSLKLALSLATNRTRDRYNAKGRKFCFASDDSVTNETFWVLSSKLKMEETEDCMTVQSPKLESLMTSGAQSGHLACKFLSPERVLDYIMTDSFKPIANQTK